METKEILELLQRETIMIDDKYYMAQDMLDDILCDYNLSAYQYEHIINSLNFLDIIITENIGKIEFEQEIDDKVKTLEEVCDNFIELYSELESNDLSDEQHKRLIDMKRALATELSIGLRKKKIEGSKSLISDKDYSKYHFNGMTLGKCKLVLEVVKFYVKENSPSINVLTSVFYKELQGSYGVVMEKGEARARVSDLGERFYTNPKDIIHINGTEFYVSSQWGVGNIEKFIEKAKRLGYEIY